MLEMHSDGDESLINFNKEDPIGGAKLLPRMKIKVPKLSLPKT